MFRLAMVLVAYRNSLIPECYIRRIQRRAKLTLPKIEIAIGGGARVRKRVARVRDRRRHADASHAMSTPAIRWINYAMPTCECAMTAQSTRRTSCFGRPPDCARHAIRPRRASRRGRGNLHQLHQVAAHDLCLVLVAEIGQLVDERDRVFQALGGAASRIRRPPGRCPPC